MRQTLGDATDIPVPDPRREKIGPHADDRGSSPMGQQMGHQGGAATLATVARAAGVSRQTVSNALNSPALLRPNTLARVQQAIEELGYTPNRAARSLRTRSSRLVGLRVDPAVEDSANALMDRFVHSLVESAGVAGYHVLLFTAGGARRTHEPYDELLRSSAVDAFVVTDTYRGTPHAAVLSAQAVPFVGFGRPWRDPSARHPWVDVDGHAGIALAVDHLVGLGHARVAWVGWRRGSLIGEDRRSGWTSRMRHHGLSTEGLSFRGEDSLAAGARAADEMLELDAARRPTAFLCASDTLAMGVLRSLHGHGLRAGRDVAVVGFDDSLAAQVSTPSVTSVRQPLEQVAVEVVRYLGELLAGRPIPEPGLVLAPTLSVRASSVPTS